MKYAPDTLDVAGKTILGICAHPDDLDFGSSGTIAKFIGEGASVYYIILTDGSKGSENLGIGPKELVSIRKKEQKEAAAVLGVKEVFFLGAVDGELDNTHPLKKKVVEIIRKLKPEIVITLDPTFFYDEIGGVINHPDHRMAGQIALDCVYPFARNSKTYPELLEQGLGPHSVKHILLSNMARARQAANFYVDISSTIDKKLEAVKQHGSQYEDFNALADHMKKRSAQIGQICGCSFAEGFVKVSISR